MNEAERYIALANLKKLAFVKQDDIEEMWHIVRSIAVLDWTLRQPEHALAVKMGDPHIDAEAKFATIVRKAQKLALQIQEEQGYTEPQNVN